MKKLMFMLVAIVCAVATQAATFKWSTGTLTIPGGDDFITSENGSWAATLSLFTDADMKTAVSGAGGLTASTPNASGALGNTVTGLTEGNTYYGIVTVTGTYGGKDYTISVTDPVQIKFKTSGTTQMNFSTAIADAGGWPTGGQGDGGAPEPTSGLLLLVGGALLGLRRKRA